MNDHLPSFVWQHEQYLRILLQQGQFPSELLKQAMSYSLLSGGKRFRPLLVYLSAELFDLPMEVRDVLAAAVEMMHCYSLIHDDLPSMDDDDFRRGRPSCHKVYGEAMAILAGDALANWSLDLLQEKLQGRLEAHSIIAIMRVLLKASGPFGMISGQCLDLDLQAGKSHQLDSIATVHRLKTGCLIMACIEMVLHAAQRRNTGIAAHLKQYATLIGLVFQMQDDYLDRFASPQTLGKSGSSDQKNLKYTFADHLGADTLHCELEQRFIEALGHLQQCGDRAAPLIQLSRQLAARTHNLK